MMLYALTRRCPSRWAPQRGSRSPARVPLGTTNIYLCLDYAGLPIRTHTHEDKIERGGGGLGRGEIILDTRGEREKDGEKKRE